MLKLVVALILARKGQFYDLVSPPYTMFFFDRFSLRHTKKYPAVESNKCVDRAHSPLLSTVLWAYHVSSSIKSNHVSRSATSLSHLGVFLYILGAKCND